MNREDEYYFFIGKAVSNPEDSGRKYYYDTTTDKLFVLNVMGENLTPHYRNKAIDPSSTKIQFFDDVIHRVNEADPAIISLRSTSVYEKRQFLDDFIEGIKDPEMKIQIKNKLLLKENESFGFTLKPIDYQIAIDFDMKSTRFLLKKAKEYYPFLDFDQIKEVIW